jgi:hypothetical protein
VSEAKTAKKRTFFDLSLPKLDCSIQAQLRFATLPQYRSNRNAPKVRTEAWSSGTSAH